MKTNEAIKIVHWALVGYIEDSAGAESEEAKAIEEAWDIIKNRLDKSEDDE